MIKKLIKKTPLYPILRRINSKIKGIPRHPIQDSETNEKLSNRILFKFT